MLVNNAGAAFATRKLSPEGIERTVAVNHLAVAALTTFLLDALRAGADRCGRPSRVVNMSSSLERRGDPHMQDWTYARRYQQVRAYCDAKLISLAHTYHLAGALDATGVTVNAADPGAVATIFGRNAGGVFRVVQLAGRLFMARPQEAASTAIRLATDPDLDGVTGQYFVAGAAGDSSPASHDPEFGARVHTRTAALLANSA